MIADASFTQSGTSRVGIDAGGEEREGDHAHRLLRVVRAVAEGHEGRRDELRQAEAPHERAGVRVPEDPEQRRTSAATPTPKPTSGASTRRDQHLQRRCRSSCTERGAAARHHRADDAADQAVGRARGQRPPPGEEVPGDGADQAAEHHGRRDGARLDDALGERRGHVGRDQRADARSARRRRRARRSAARARVEIEVATAFAASWKPLVKSKTSAVTTTAIRRPSIRRSRAPRPRPRWRRPRTGRRRPRRSRRSPST